MTECILCRDGKEHEWTYDSFGFKYLPIHVIENCAYYLCKQLGDRCPNCCPDSTGSLEELPAPAEEKYQ